MGRKHTEEEKRKISLAIRLKYSDPAFREKQYQASIRARRAHPELYRTEPRIKPLLFPSPSLSYVLGVLSGDGFIQKSGYRIALCCREKCFAESFRIALEKIGLHPSKIYRDSRGYFRVQAFSKIFCDWYFKLDYSEIRKIVSKYPLEYIRGFYESEGSIRRKPLRHTYELRMTNTNFDTISTIAHFLDELGLAYHINKRTRKTMNGKTVYDITLYHDVPRFLELIKPCIKYVGLS